MRLKLKAFPVVYFTVTCKKHDCWVKILPKMSTDQTDMNIVGAQLIAVECQVGGEAKNSRCVDDWEMSISSTGDVVVSS